MVTLLNRGERTWDLHDAVEKNGKLVRRVPDEKGQFDKNEKVIKRKLHPGGTIESIDDLEATLMLGYTREIVDAEKVVPQMGDKVKLLNDRIAELEKTIADYQERLKKYEGADAGEEEDKKKKGGKDK